MSDEKNVQGQSAEDRQKESREETLPDEIPLTTGPTNETLSVSETIDEAGQPETSNIITKTTGMEVRHHGHVHEKRNGKNTCWNSLC